jgi:hypothetical protein
MKRLSLRRLWRAIALLRGPAPLIGTALLLLQLAAALSDPTAKMSDWLLYLLPVTLVPAVWALGSWRRLPRRLRRGLQIVGALTTLLTALSLVLRLPWPLFAVSGLQWWLLRRRVNVADAGAARWSAGLGEALLIAVGWAIALRIAWWDTAGSRLAADARQLLLLIAVTPVLQWALLSRRPGARSLRLLDAAVALLLFGFALRSDMIVGDALGPILGPSALHHWGAIAGPAALVRAGGLPLWDVPLQYGWLSTLTIAWLPFDVWTNLYLLQALLQTATAWLIYRVLRSGGGLPAAVFAAALATAAVFLAAGYREPLSGNYAWPSMGALRYVWIYALLSVLFVLQRRPLLQSRLLPLGDGLWLIGVLWSFESAIACSAVWLPATLLLLEPPQPGRRAWCVAAGRRLLRPLLSLAGLLAAVSLFYQLRYGLWPDWLRYADYLLAFGTRFSPSPVELLQRDGAVLPALVGGVTAAAYGVLRLQRGDRVTAALLIAAATALWAISSYALQRGLELLFGTIALPVLLLTFGLLLAVQRRGQLGRSGRPWTAALVLPAAALLLVTNSTHPQAVDALQQALRPQQQAPITQLLPAADRELDELLARAGVQPHEALATATTEIISLPAAYRAQPGWLPTLPQLMYLPLTAEQAARYLERAAARAPGGGWLLTPLDGGLWPAGWLHERLVRTHLAGRTYRSAHWQLRWYERRAQPLTESSAVWQLSRPDTAVWRYLSGDPADPADWRELTTALRDIYGRPGVDGWLDGASEPLIGFDRERSTVLAHPGPQRALIIIWRSPLAGRVVLSGSLHDLDDSCGDGVSRQLRLPDGRQLDGGFANGGADSFTGGPPLAVVPGSKVIFVLEQAGEYSCDSTAVELQIELVPAAPQP